MTHKGPDNSLLPLERLYFVLLLNAAKCSLLNLVCLWWHHMLLQITEGADGKEFKSYLPLIPLAVKHPNTFIDLTVRAVLNANKGIFNLRHYSALLIVDCPPFSLSDLTGCLHLLFWSVLDSQRGRVTLRIYSNHSKNNQKAVEKYQGGDSGKAQLSYLLPCKYSTSPWKSPFYQNMVTQFCNYPERHRNSPLCVLLTSHMGEVKLFLYSEERSKKLLLCLWLLFECLHSMSSGVEDLCAIECYHCGGVYVLDQNKYSR